LTTIASDGRTMAGDSLTSDAGGIRVSADPKVRRIREALVGCAGRADDAEAFFRWYAGGAKIGDDPALSQNFIALITTRAGMFICHANCYPIPIENEVCTIGSGHEIARGAMAMGASPERAVEIACELDTRSGPPVVVERL
jgi:ATP-dependent protease HslVU (ClpYQ) peptidase subunit